MDASSSSVGEKVKSKTSRDLSEENVVHEQSSSGVRNENHTEEADEKGVMLSKQSNLDIEARTWQCVVKKDGIIYCRIDGDCRFRQKKFRIFRFLRHFRMFHRRAAKEKDLYVDLPRLLEEADHGPRKPINLAEMVRSHVVTDENGTHCRISDLFCSYVQTTFREDNFRRHFLYIHPKEAEEHGFSVKSQPQLKPKFPSRTDAKPNYYRIMEKCVRKTKKGYFCKISAFHCPHVQRTFDPVKFIQHFRKDHPEEARAKGLLKKDRAQIADKPDHVADPLAIKQEILDEPEQPEIDEDDDEAELLIPDDAALPTEPLTTSIAQLVEENIARYEIGIFCHISSEPCDYIRSEGFDPKDFARHFRAKHPQEAREKGFYGKNDDAPTGEHPRKIKRIRDLVAENVLVDGEGIHCMIAEAACGTVQRTYNVGNFVRHFRDHHPKEAEEKGLLMRKIFTKRREKDRGEPTKDDMAVKVKLEDQSESESAAIAESTPKPATVRLTLRSQVEQYVKTDASGFHCRLVESCPYMQFSEFRAGNFYRHFLMVHPEQASAAGFDADRLKRYCNRPADRHDNRRRQKDQPSFRDLVVKYVAKNEKGIQCRIASWRCKYIQKTYNPGNFVRHFRSEHPIEATEAGFYGPGGAEPESEELEPEVPAKDEPEKRKTKLTFRQLAEKYIRNDDEGVRCRISAKPCSYVQWSFYDSGNFIRHFRKEHPVEAREAGFFRDANEHFEPEMEPVELVTNGEESMDESLAIEASQSKGASSSGGPRRKRKPTFRELAEQCIFLGKKGIHCRISSEPCKFVQRSIYDATNFIRHFRMSHPNEAREIGFFRDYEQSSGPETEQETVETVKKKPTFRELTEKYIFRDEKGVHCRISSTPCRYVQGNYDPGNFVRHFRYTHPKEAHEIGFFRSEEFPEGTVDFSLRKPFFSELTEQCIFRGKDGVECRISSELCRYVQRSNFDATGFIKHFCKEHPKEARERGFFRIDEGSSEPETQLISCEEGTMDSFSIEESQPKRSCPDSPSGENLIFKENSRQVRAIEAERESGEQVPCNEGTMDSFSFEESQPKRPRLDRSREKNNLSFKRLAELYIFRDQTGMHCRISAEPCKYFQRSRYDPGNFIRHFRYSHPKEAREIGFLRDETTEPETEFAEEATMDSSGFNESQQRSSVKKGKRKKVYFRDLAEQYIFRDAKGVHCRISSLPCTYIQKRYDPGNLIRHFRSEHADRARQVGFFRKANETSEPETGRDSVQLESIAQDVKMEPSAFEDSQQEELRDSIQQILTENPEEAADIESTVAKLEPVDYEPYEEQMESTPIAKDQPGDPNIPEGGPKRFSIVKPTMKQLAEHYILRDEQGVHCRISSEPCKYVQSKYHSPNLIRHFRMEHPNEALDFGFLKESDLEAVDQDKPSLMELAKECIVQDDKGFHCRISGQGCQYVQRKYVTTNFYRHFRNVHPEEAREKGFFRGPNESEERNAELELVERNPEEDGTMEEGSIEESLLEEADLNRNDASDCTPTLPQHVEHPKEAKEMGLAQDEISETDARNAELELIEQVLNDYQESQEDELSDGGGGPRMFKGGKPIMKQLVEQYIFRDGEKVYCRLSSKPCKYVQLKYHPNNFIRHFRNNHPVQARQIGFLRGEPNEQNAELEYAEQNLYEDEAVESSAFEESQLEDPSADTIDDVQRENDRPLLKKLTEKFIFRDEMGAHCRMPSEDRPCKFVQRFNFCANNFIRHFRTRHPEEAKAEGFFPEPESDSGGNVEGSSQKKQIRPRNYIQRRKDLPSLSKLVEQYSFRDVNGAVHCRISSMPCNFIQSPYVAGNFIRHFRNRHPVEAREIGFFGDEPSESESESVAQDVLMEPNVDETQLEEPDTPRDDPALYCRLCFSVDLPLVPVFNELDGTDNPLVESIAECTGVHLTAEDGASICSQCSQKLVSFQQFRQLSQQCDSVARRKRERLATNAVAISSETDTFYVEVVKEETSLVEDPAEHSRTLEGTSTSTTSDTADQKPFIELPDGTFSCRLCPKTFPTLGPTMEHFTSAHSQPAHSEPPPTDHSSKQQTPPTFKQILINGIHYHMCSDCNTLTVRADEIIAHWRRFHADRRDDPTISCGILTCEEIFMDDAAYRRHLQICHSAEEVYDMALEGV